MKMGGPPCIGLGTLMNLYIYNEHLKILSLSQFLNSNFKVCSCKPFCVAQSSSYWFQDQLEIFSSKHLKATIIQGQCTLRAHLNLLLGSKVQVDPISATVGRPPPPHGDPAPVWDPRLHPLTPFVPAKCLSQYLPPSLPALPCSWVEHQSKVPPSITRPSKQCEFCIYLDKLFDQSGLSEWFDWSGWSSWSKKG